MTSRQPPAARTAPEHEERDMSGKNKGGREAKKPTQEQNKKSKGQTPQARSALDAIKQPVSRTKH
ncbi:MAG: hypothetical protein M3P95_11320 [Actinomycetota bacterium]|jgi:hypothetical protein|nr:hypothetical protein [Actinomycetota bacterium]